MIHWRRMAMENITQPARRENRQIIDFDAIWEDKRSIFLSDMSPRTSEAVNQWETLWERSPKSVIIPYEHSCSQSCNLELSGRTGCFRNALAGGEQRAVARVVACLTRQLVAITICFSNLLYLRRFQKRLVANCLPCLAG